MSTPAPTFTESTPWPVGPTPAQWQGVTALPELGLIDAQGADTAAFLHGQLSQDIQLLPAGEARLAAYCTAKGRMLADFTVWRRGDDGVRLLISAALLPATLKRLSMFVLRAKVRLSDALAGTAPVRLHGIVGLPLLSELAAQASAAVPEPMQVLALPDGAELIRLPDVCGAARALWVGPADAAMPLATQPALPHAAWAWLDVMSAVPRIEAGTVEQFVPQMINYEVVGGVNFRKGCYPGQEIVARSQYRGTVKRRLHLAQLAPGASAEAVKAGQEVFSDTDPDQPCGMVVNAAPAPDGGWVCSLELKLEQAQAALHVGSASGPALRLLALPYELPTADA